MAKASSLSINLITPTLWIHNTIQNVTNHLIQSIAHSLNRLNKVIILFDFF